MTFPHSRHLLVKAKTIGSDPLVDAVLSETEDGSESMARSKYEAAKMLWLSPIKRNYLDAALISTDDLPDIALTLDFPIDIVTTYRDFFFNVTGSNRLHKLAVIEEYEPEGKNLLVWALASGLTFLKWRLGETVTINPIEGLKDMFSMATYKSKEALFSTNGSPNSVEAVKWTKLSMDLARLLKMYLMDANAAKNDIEMALAQINPNFTSFAGLDDIEPLP